MVSSSRIACGHMHVQFIDSCFGLVSSIVCSELSRVVQNSEDMVLSLVVTLIVPTCILYSLTTNYWPIANWLPGASLPN